MTTEPPVNLPPIAVWLAAEGKDRHWLAAVAPCSAEYVRQWCLPLDDVRRSVPSRRMRLRIERVTDGVVGPDDWPARFVPEPA
jgi:hypothetical protein